MKIILHFEVQLFDTDYFWEYSLSLEFCILLALQNSFHILIAAQLECNKSSLIKHAVH